MISDGYGEGGGENSDGASGSVTRYSVITDDLDADFDVLSDAHRRYLLYHLFDMDGEVTDLDEAVDAVRAYETAGTECDESPSREHVRTLLHHAHLPRLESVGIVDYDPRQGTVRFTGHPSLEEFAEHARHKEVE